MHVKAQSQPLDIIKIPRSWKTVLYNLFLISAGNVVFVIGMNSVLIPNKLFGAGVSGIALILHYLFPRLDVGLAYFLLNLPLMLLGWLSISRRFMFYTLYGMGFFSLAAAVIKTPALTLQDPILAALFGGIICGAGAGIVLRSIGSAGGMDIVAIYVNQKFGFRPGSISLFVNGLILMLGAYFFRLEIALYTLIYVFASSRVLDLVITGFNQRMSTLIISENPRKLLKRFSSGSIVAQPFLKAGVLTLGWRGMLSSP